MKLNVKRRPGYLRIKVLAWRPGWVGVLAWPFKGNWLWRKGE